MTQPVIKWSGSKRSQAEIIKKLAPSQFNTYYEPFLGGGSVLYSISPERSVCGDICKPLIDLWLEIKLNPSRLVDEYETRWTKLQQEGHTAFYSIRDDFNERHSPYDLMFLSRTCVNGLIRFNQKGEFNNALHHSRPGINPNRLRNIVFDWSTKIQNTDFVSEDYEISTRSANSNDFVYLDPPYFHTKGRYFGSIDFDRFIAYLENLNSRKIKYILSFDGKRGDKDYMVELPKDLYKHHELLPSGKSTFRKVIDKANENVFESLYMNY